MQVIGIPVEKARRIMLIQAMEQLKHYVYERLEQSNGRQAEAWASSEDERMARWHHHPSMSVQGS